MRPHGRHLGAPSESAKLMVPKRFGEPGRTPLTVLALPAGCRSGLAPIDSDPVTHYNGTQHVRNSMRTRIGELMRLAGKVAIVTGSTKGIGVGIAKKFAAEGAKVVVSGRTASKGEEVVAQIEAAGGEAIFVGCDLADTTQCRELVDATVTHFGALDVLVNNAAPLELITGGSEKPIADQTAEEFEAFIRIGVLGTAAMIRYALPPMVNRGRGSIVNISSGSSIMGVTGTPGYSSSKGAINSLTRQVAVDYGALGIRCNTIVVGLVAIGDVTLALLENPVFEKALKSMTVMSRLGSPEDIAEGALYLASDAADWVTGSALSIDGGASIKTAVPDMSGDRRCSIDDFRML